MSSFLRSSFRPSSVTGSNEGFPTPRLKSRIGRSRPFTAATFEGALDNHVICAVSEARGISPVVGLSFLNLSTSEAILCQLSDTQTYARTCHKISVFSPSEVVFITTAVDSKLISVLRENLNTDLNQIRMTAIDRRYWSETAGHDYIRTLAIPTDLESLRYSTANTYYAVCCFGAIAKYIDLNIGLTFLPQNLRIRAEPSEGAMMIDASTLRSLEIVQNLANAKSRECLFGLIDQTCTRMGARFLKSNILQPSTDKTKLLNRYSAVSELTENEEKLAAIRQALSGFVDTDRLLTSLVIVEDGLDFSFMEQVVNTAIILKSFVDMIMPVWQSMASFRCEELCKIRQLCAPETYADVQDLLQHALNEDVHFSSKPAELRNQRVWALNAGVNGFLDVARQTYVELSQDVELLVQTLRDQYELKLELKFDPARQYYIRFKSIELEENITPDVFINVFRKKGVVECQTMDLIKLNQKLKDAHNEVILMSNQSIRILITNVRTKLHPLFKISEAISLLDMLSGFAELAVLNDYVRPELTSTLALEGGRHPICENIQHDRFIPNKVYATQQSRFQIITGCNMSGKSTYIRSIALMAIMAQVGCFVPAEYASFPIMHQLFARISTDDSIEANASSFASEMRDMAYILHNIEPRTVVLVDELGRGTSTNDGLTTAIAICEALIESKALVWFVTHFRELPHILAQRAGVVNLHLATEIEPDLSDMRMQYRITDGIEAQTNYGIALATAAGLPLQIINKAIAVTKHLNSCVEKQRQSVQSQNLAKRRDLVYKLKEQLIQASESDVDAEAVRKWLKQLQEEFVLRMNMLDNALHVMKDSIDGDWRGKSSASNPDEDMNVASQSVSFSDELVPQSSAAVAHNQRRTFVTPGTGTSDSPQEMHSDTS